MPDLGDMGNKAGSGLKKLLSNKVVLYGGIGVGALVLGYLYLQNQSANASNSGGGGYANYTPVDYTGAGTPAVIGSSGGSSDSGSTDALAAAINAANQNSAAQNQEALTALQESANISIANDQTSSYETQLATQASNYAASTNVLKQFIGAAGGQGAAVLGVGGSITPTSAGGASVDLFADNSKNILAWGTVLHGIADQGTPSAGAQGVVPVNPVVGQSGLVPGPIQGRGGT